MKNILELISKFEKEKLSLKILSSPKSSCCYLNIYIKLRITDLMSYSFRSLRNFAKNPTRLQSPIISSAIDLLCKAFTSVFNLFLNMVFLS